MTEYRIESDSLGEVKVPYDKYWGAQTQRSLENFPIGKELLSDFPEFIQALGIIKRSCAEVNSQLGLLNKELSLIIVQAAQEIIEGKFIDHFPLVVWQTGSGTQTNMNINEVIANRANQIFGSELGIYSPIHPNDHVNYSQSSNDVIPTAMHISAVKLLNKKFIPALKHLLDTLLIKESEFSELVKVGRTHLMDATPITLGQEFSSFATQISKGIRRLNNCLPHLYEIALGGTAIGTGINTHPEFASLAATQISKHTKEPFISATNKFEGIGAHDAMVELSSSLKVVAGSLMKIANDIRWLASGPRTGLKELILPSNEPGSSIMPGKINPTQCEAVLQVVTQVYGNDLSVSFAGSQGNLELNVFKPVIIYNILQSLQLLSDVTLSFTDRCLVGIKANNAVLQNYSEQNLMIVTALSPQIGYEKAAKIAQEAFISDLSLKEVLLKKGLLTKKEIDKILDAKKLTKPNL